MKERFEVLDIFRGIFSSLVVLFHMSTFSDTPLINNPFIYNSDLFVDFFFVLSGFVIAYSYQSISTGEELNRFYKKRFFRLYPLHLIVLLAFVCIELTKNFAAAYVQVNNLDNAANSWTSFFSNLFLLNSVKMPGVPDVSWNIASWSISAEMIAYLVFGFTMLQIARAKLNRVKLYIFAGVVVTAMGVMHFFTGTLGLLYTFDYGFLRGIAGFFTGVICFSAFDTYKGSIRTLGNSLFSVLELLMLTLTITLVCYGDTFKSYGLIYLMVFFVTILVFAFQKGWLSEWLKKSKFLHKTGQYSYSIYMIHTLILSLFNVLFFRILKLPPSAYAYMFIVNYAIIWIASAWTFKHIEMRFNLSTKKEPVKKAWWVW